MPVPAASSKKTHLSRCRSPPSNIVSEINKEHRAKAVIVKMRNPAGEVVGPIRS
jgi:hypothetical protein